MGELRYIDWVALRARVVGSAVVVDALGAALEVLDGAHIDVVLEEQTARAR